MDNLKFFSSTLVKLVFGAIFFLAYYYLYAFIKADYFVFGYREGSYVVSFSIATVIVVYAVKVALNLVGAKKLNERFMASVKWAFYAAVLVGVVYFAFSRYSALKGSGSHLLAILKVGGYCAAGYIAYIIAASILYFLGVSFGLLADGLPSGRGVFFNEILNNAYSKPQIRVFMGNLNVLNGGAVYVYTTLILYGMPILAILVAPWPK